MHNRAKVGDDSMRPRAAWIAMAIALVASGLLYVGAPRVRAVAQVQTGAMKATATLRFDGVSPEGGGGSAGDFGLFRDTEIAMLRSRPILEEVFRRHPELLKTALLVDRADPSDWLANRLETQVVPNTRLVNLSLDSPVWQESAAIVDAVVEAYLASSSDSRDRSFVLRIKRLNAMRREARGVVEIRRRELRKAEDSASDDAIIEVRRGLEIQDLREIRQAKRKLLIDKAAAEAILARKKSDKEASPLVVTPLEDHVAALSAQVAMLSRDEEKGLTVLQKLEPSHVDFHRLRKEIERAEERAEDIEKEIEQIDRESGSATARVTVLSPAR